LAHKLSSTDVTLDLIKDSKDSSVSAYKLTEKTKKNKKMGFINLC
jgi:ribosomal protein L21